ncbi:MAG: GntR family transcriptional regulator [bacterium]|nr:GntR family transcriptional regulator [bacterium]
MQTIKYDAGIPLYIQLQNILKEKILRGEYQVGGQIPPENELCEIYDVSRITVRKAIDTLVQEKLLYRLQGKGTFVASVKVKRDLPKLYSVSRELQESGLIPSSRLVEKVVIEADESLQTILHLPENNLLINRIIRVRLANDEPIYLEDAYIPAYLCPGLVDKDIEHDSLYRMFREDYQLSLEYAEENYEVTSMDTRTAELLGCRENALAFFFERITFSNTDVPIAFAKVIGRGDKLRLSVKLVRNDNPEFARTVDL